MKVSKMIASWQITMQIDEYLNSLKNELRQIKKRNELKKWILNNFYPIFIQEAN